MEVTVKSYWKLVVVWLAIQSAKDQTGLAVIFPPIYPVGDKNNYDYVVRWVHNPRERSLPYSPTLKRDLTPEDYQKEGKPFKFDEDDSVHPMAFTNCRSRHDGHAGLPAVRSGCSRYSHIFNFTQDRRAIPTSFIHAMIRRLSQRASPGQAIRMRGLSRDKRFGRSAKDRNRAYPRRQQTD